MRRNSGQVEPAESCSTGDKAVADKARIKRIHGNRSRH
jgi:hypothetical protein